MATSTGRILVYGVRKEDLMSRPTTVRLSEEEVQNLEQIARRRGVTISRLIQEAVVTMYPMRNRQEAMEALIRFVNEHPHPVEDTVEEIEDRIERGLADAARG